MGHDGVVAHHDGADWTVEPAFTTADLHAVHASAPDEVWVAGQGGAIFHGEAGAWFPVRAGDGAQPDLTGISSAGGYVWFVGDQGAVLALRHASPWAP